MGGNRRGAFKKEIVGEERVFKGPLGAMTEKALSPLREVKKRGTRRERRAKGL